MSKLRGKYHFIVKLVRNSVIYTGRAVFAISRRIHILYLLRIRPILVFVYILLMRLMLSIESRWIIPFRARLVRRYSIFRKWDTWKYRPQFRNISALFMAVFFC